MNRTNQKTLPGRYRLTLLFGGSSAKSASPSAFDATIHLPGRSDPIVERINANQASLRKTIDLELSEPGTVRLTLTPVEGKARISGVVLEPLN